VTTIPGRDALAVARPSTAQVQRLATITAALGLAVDVDADRAYADILRDLVADTSRSPEFRACVAWLAVTATYPRESDIHDLVAFLRHGREAAALQSLASAAAMAGRSPQRRELRRPHAQQIDVTSVSRESRLSGIPRTVINLIRGASSEAATHVWSHGVPGPVTLLADDTFEFDTAIWSGSLTSKWPYAQLRRAYRSLRAAAATSRAAAALYRVVTVLGRPLLAGLAGDSGPRVGILLSDCTVVLPEVCAPDVADRLTTWRTHVGGFTLAVLIHDLLPVTDPQHFQSGHPEVFLAFLRAAGVADIVTTTTVASAHKVRALAALLGVAEPVIRTVALPVTSRSWSEAPASSTVLPQFTCLGTVEPRKNHRTLLRACEELASRRYPVILNIVGSLSRMDDDTRAAIVAAREAGAEVRLVPGADDATVKGLMLGSVASVLVSWSEGYGLPVLESLACGVPVITSDVEPLSDFAAFGGVLLVDPSDHIAIADAMLNLVADPQARSRLADSIDAAAIPVSVAHWASAVLAPASATNANALGSA
jgi:glycosyltransferase involved in cell wall biosynthesis